MKKIFSPELVGAIADSIKNAATPPPNPPNSPDAPAPKPMAKPLAFIGQLLSNAAVSGFVGGGRPETALLRGSLVGLASGVDAVSGEAKTASPGQKPKAGNMALTVGAYVAGGILAALIFRGMRGGAASTSPAATN